MFDTIIFTIGFTLALTKGAFMALSVIYPSYKTYKALESRSLRAAQGMLLYWCITAFISSIKEFVDQIFGNYANIFLWKFIVLALRAAPLIIGPDRLYTMIVKPLYEKNSQHIDAVVDEAHKIKSIATDTLPAVKSGNVSGVGDAVGEIVETVKQDSAGIVNTLQEKAAEVTETIQKKTAQLGVEIDRKGVLGFIDALIAQFESLREIAAASASKEWRHHGPMIKSTTKIATDKAVAYKDAYVPVAKEKISNVYQQKVLPRVQPIVARMKSTLDESVRPFVYSKRDRVVQMWQKRSAPLRRVYGTHVQPIVESRVQPFVQNSIQPFFFEKFLPWVQYSFLPAVLETLIAMKDRLVDLASSPSEETRRSRAHHKRRRAEVRRERRSRGTKIGLNSLKDEVMEAAGTATASPSGHIYKRQKTSPPSSSSHTTLRNRKSNISSDSSKPTSNPTWSEPTDVRGTELDPANISEVASHSDLNAEAKPFEPHMNLSPHTVLEAQHTEEQPGTKEGDASYKPLLPTPKEYQHLLSSNKNDTKQSRSNSIGEKGENAWGTEPRANQNTIAAE